MSNRPLGIFVSVASRWLEVALAICALLLPPLLALLPRGATALVSVAALSAALLVAIDPARRLAYLRFPAAILGLLILWGGLSALWSINPWRSLIIDARLAGLFVIGLTLAGAAGRVASPSRLALAASAGTVLGIAAAAADLVTWGGLSRHLSVRPFDGPRLDQIAAWLTLLALPIGALFARRGRRLPALLGTAAALAGVFLLYDSTAKVAAAAGLAAAVLCWFRRPAVARAAALISVVAILTAPVTLPYLARIPGAFTAIDNYKVSAGHRFLIWSFTGDRIAERPFLGWGLDSSRAIPGGKDEIRPGETWLPLHPHDAALQVWLELGAPGAALFALFVGFLWLRLAAAPWPPLPAAAAGGSLAAALIFAVSGWGVWEEWWIATQAFALFVILVIARASFEAARRDAQDDGDT